MNYFIQIFKGETLVISAKSDDKKALLKCATGYDRWVLFQKAKDENGWVFHKEKNMH